MDDGETLHPLLCEHGGAKSRPHESVKMVCGGALRRAGAFIDYERVIPELADQVRRHASEHGQSETGEAEKDRVARLDVVASWPGQTTAWWLDVSVRCPTAERYAAEKPAAADSSTKGEAEKALRYGQAVRPIVFESMGRLGFRSQRTLHEFASAAEQAGSHHARFQCRNGGSRWSEL